MGKDKNSRLNVNYLSVTYSDGAVASGFTLTYKDSVDDTTLTSENVEEGASSTKYLDANPTKDGFSFGGWFTDKNCTQAVTLPLTLTEDTTIYAKWNDLDKTDIASVTEDNTYYRISGEVTAKTNDQTIYVQDDTGAIQVYMGNGFFKDIEIGNSVSLTGKRQLNNNNPQLSSVINLVCDSTDTEVSTLPLTESANITAENANKYVDLKGLKISSVANKTIRIESESFVLYYTSEAFVDGIDTVNTSVGAYVNVKGAVLLYRDTVQVAITSIANSEMATITYVTNGGSAVESESVLVGKTFTKPTNPEKATANYTKYTFDNWYTDPELTKPYNFSTAAATDITVYAKWLEEKVPNTSVFADQLTTSELSVNYTKKVETTNSGVVSHSLSLETYESDGFILSNVNAPTTESKYFELKKDKGYIEYEVTGKISGSISVDYNVQKTGTNTTTFDIVSLDENKQEIETISSGALADSQAENTGTLELTNSSNVKYLRLVMNKATGSNLRLFSLDYKFDSKSETTTYQLNDASIRYGTKMTSSAYDENAKYGLIITSNKKLTENKITLPEIFENCDENNDGVKSSTEFITYLDTFTEIQSQKYELTPERVNNNGQLDANGDYYQFGVRFTGALGHIDTELCAVTYMELNGAIYISKPTTYSLRSLAQAYIDNNILADNEDAVGVLNAIVSYK